MTATKKSIRFLTVLALIFAMVLSIASVSVSAAGVETWYKNSSYFWENSFTIRGYNLTPVKTIGESGVISFDFTLLKVLDTNTNSNPFIFKGEIRTTSGEVLYSRSYECDSSNEGLPFGWFTTAIPVTKGQKIQVFISAYDTVTGVYRTVEVEYGHWLR